MTGFDVTNNLDVQSWRPAGVPIFSAVRLPFVFRTMPSCPRQHTKEKFSLPAASALDFRCVQTRFDFIFRLARRNFLCGAAGENFRDDAELLRVLRRRRDAPAARPAGDRAGVPGQSAKPREPQPAGALRDSFVLAGGKFRTHAAGKAYDRILISAALENGASNWKFEKVFAQPHTHGKGEEKKLFTDHFPVTAIFNLVPKK